MTSPDPSTALAADFDALERVVAQIPVAAAWTAVLAGCPLQAAFDADVDLRRDLAGELRLSGFTDWPLDFAVVDWALLAAEAGLGPVDLAALAADHARRAGSARSTSAL